MTAPMAPAPVPPPPPPGQAAVPPSAAPGQDQTQPTQSPPGGGESATDTAAGDPMQWLVAAEADARYGMIERPTLNTGLLGE